MSFQCPLVHSIADPRILAAPRKSAAAASAEIAETPLLWAVCHVTMPEASTAFSRCRSFPRCNRGGGARAERRGAIREPPSPDPAFIPLLDAPSRVLRQHPSISRCHGFLRLLALDCSPPAHAAPQR